MGSQEGSLSSLHTSLQLAQSRLQSWGLNLWRLLSHHPHLSSESHVPSPPNNDQSFTRQLDAWNKNSAWTDTPAVLQVKTPKGMLCELSSNFQIGLPPDDLFDILVDPGNKRVFKNIKEITYRKVLEDHGSRQLVEVEQAAIWRFLWLSGTLVVRVIVDQNRETHKVKYTLSQEGFMKKFEGTWDIKPIYVDAPHCGSMASPESDPVCVSSRVASDVTLKQAVQTKIVPPPPISWYVRGITARQTEMLLEDLQAEAKRLRETHEGYEI